MTRGARITRTWVDEITSGQLIQDMKVAEIDPVGSQFQTMLMRIHSPHLRNVRLHAGHVASARNIMREGDWLSSPNGLTEGRIIEVRYDRPDDWFDRGEATMVIEKPWLRPSTERVSWLEDELFPRLT